MRKTPLIIGFVLSFFAIVNAQKHGLGLTVGASGYYGDLGQDALLYPNKLAYGFSYKWYGHERWVPRVTMTFMKINPTTDLSSDPSFRTYGLDLNRSIREIAAGVEFSFFEYRPWKIGSFQWTPYFVFELAAYQYNQYSSLSSSATVSSGIQANEKSVFGMAIPLGVGVKVNPWYRISIAFEVRVRYALTDRLDDGFFIYENYLNPNDVKYANRFTNVNTKDFYTFAGFTITYLLGNRPCFR